MMINYIKHKTLLLKILNDIFSDNSINFYLGFKGGTAAMLFYGLKRGSIDIDLDFLQENFNSDTLEEVFEKIKNISSKYGDIMDYKIKKFGTIIVISYADEAQNIKIEINFRQFGSEYELKNLFGLSILVMKKEDMFAHKLMAMYERMEYASRDIYDVNFFENNDWNINKQIVETRSGICFKEFLSKCIKRLEQKDSKHILLGLGELLDDSQKNWVKTNLISNTLFLLRNRLNNLTFLDELSPFLNTEIQEIKRILNERFLEPAFFFCKELNIKKGEISWRVNGEPCYGYIVEGEYFKNQDKTQYVRMYPEKKIEGEKIARDIAIKIQSETQDEQLRKQLPFKSK